MQVKVEAERIRQLRQRGTVSLRDLAELAGADLSTVSRALNFEPRISQDRASAIRKLAQSVGYRPRPLRAERTGAVGVLIASTQPDRPDQQFLQRIAWLAQQVLNDRRLHVNLECVRRSDGHVSSPLIPAIIEQNRVDGVLLAGHPPVELVERIRTLGVPAVAINDTAQRLGIDCVRSDPAAAMHAGILRLAAWGHRRFGLLMNKMDYPTAQARYDSYVAALQHINIKPDPAWFITDLGDELAGGRDGIRGLAQRGPLPTAIICCNDWMALGALQELQRQGMRVPQDISLIGHDDLSFCEQLEPPLTSIHRAEETIVARAVDRLRERIENRDLPVTETMVEGEIVWRASTGPAPDSKA